MTSSTHSRRMKVLSMLDQRVLAENRVKRREAMLPGSETKRKLTASEITDVRKFMKDSTELSIDGNDLRQLRASFNFIMLREYGGRLPRQYWGLPQAFLWSALDMHDKVKDIPKGGSIAIDASAMAPLNVSSGRIHDYTLLTNTYSSRRFRLVLNALERVTDTIEAMSLAAIAASPELILSVDAHERLWRRGIPYSSLRDGDYFPITLQGNLKGLGQFSMVL